MAGLHSKKQHAPALPARRRRLTIVRKVDVEGRRVGGRRHRVHHDREEGLGSGSEASLPLSSLLHSADRRELLR